MKNKPFIFILVVLLVSWLVQYLIFAHLVPASFMRLYMFVPAITAFFFFFADKDPWRKQAKLFTRPINLKGLSFAVFFPLLWFAVIVILGLVTGMGKINTVFLPNLTDGAFLLSYLWAIILSLPMMFGEEYGWRGYLLPALSEQHGKVKAATIVGIVWGLWHIPSYYLVYSSLGLGDPIFLTLVGMIAVFVSTFAYTYGFFLTKNILPSALMHSIYDVTATAIAFGMPAVAGLTEGSPGLLDIAWPKPNFLIIISGAFFAYYFIKRLQKMAG